MVATQARPLYAECVSASSNGQRRFMAYYQVETTDKNDGPITARDAPGVPVVNDTFVFGNDFDNGAYATEYTARLENPGATRKKWTVSVLFDSRETRRNDDQFLENPLDRPAIISGDGLRFTVMTDKDANGQDITNTAEDLLPQEKDASRQILRIQKNQASVNLETFRSYTDSLNNASFFGLSAGKWKMGPPNWEQVFQGSDTAFFRVIYEFEANLDGWGVEPIDQGFYYISNNVKRVMDDDEGNPTNAMGYLETGDKLTTGLPPQRLPEIALYPQKDFSALNIPTDFT